MIGGLLRRLGLPVNEIGSMLSLFSDWVDLGSVGAFQDTASSSAAEDVGGSAEDAEKVGAD